VVAFTATQIPNIADRGYPKELAAVRHPMPYGDLARQSSALLTCPSCQGRMRLIAVVKNPASIARFRVGHGLWGSLPFILVFLAGYLYTSLLTLVQQTHRPAPVRAARA
jgi:predicted GTPase